MCPPQGACMCLSDVYVQYRIGFSDQMVRQCSVNLVIVTGCETGNVIVCDSVSHLYVS